MDVKTVFKFLKEDIHTAVFFDAGRKRTAREQSYRRYALRRRRDIFYHREGQAFFTTAW